MIDFLLNNFSAEIDISELLGKKIPSAKKNFLKSEFSKLYKKTKEDIFDLNKKQFFRINEKGNLVCILNVDKTFELLKNSLNKTSFIADTIQKRALIHDTHNAANKINNSAMYFYKHFNKDQDLKALLFDDDYYNFEKKYKNLIIIENLIIFDLKGNDFLNYYKKFDVSFQLDENDIILYGSGNQITNTSFNYKFLEHFDNILYFGDYDKEGYEIYLNFKKDYNVKYIFPLKEVIEDIQFKMNDSKVILARQEKEKNNSGLLPDCNLKKILNVKYEMQQEVFI